MSAREIRRVEASDQILEAAAEAIAEHGFHGMSMRALATATGMALANFYNYFDSKEDLLFELHKRAFATLLEATDAELHRTTVPEEQLYLFIASHVGFFVHHTAVMRVLVHEAGRIAPKHRATIRQIKDEYFSRARDIVGAIVKQHNEVVLVDIERSTYCIFGMMNWVYAWYIPDQHGTAADVARTIHKMALAGLTGKNDPADVPNSEKLLEALPSPIRRKEPVPP